MSIDCALLEAERELLDFDCGNSSVNALVAKSFLAHAVKQQLTYKILYQNIVVGFWTVSMRGVTLDNSDAKVAECYEDPPEFGAVKLNYIAVSKEVQGCGIGSSALWYIIKKAQELYQQWPVRMLILDAIRDKMEWYQKFGFEAICQEDISSDSATVQMYLDLMPDREKGELDAYTSHIV